MTLSSCLYTGSLAHRRLRPRVHSLRYRVFWMLIDLDEVDALSAGLSLCSRNRFNLTSFHDCDHGDGSDAPLRRQAEALLQKAQCDVQGGKIMLLCMPRILGYGFNPLSVYFCYRQDGELGAVIYEVHNTFGERHSYAIACEGQTNGTIEQRCAKEFYVSPFLGMDMSYEFRIRAPGAQVQIAIRGNEDGQTVIAANLSGTRVNLTDRAILAAFAGHPLLTLKIIGAIHWHALRMVLKGFRFHPRKPSSQHSVTIVPRNGISS